MTFIEVSLEALLQKAASDRKYRVLEKNHPSGEIYEATIIATATDGTKTYAAEKTLSIYHKEEKIVIDNNGLPFYEGNLGPIPYKRHDIFFLGNRSFAGAMSQSHQRAVFEVLAELKRTKHTTYNEFRKAVETVIAKLPAIKDAYDGEYYNVGKSKLMQFSDWEKTAFRYMTAKHWYSWEGYRPRNHTCNNVSLQQRQKVDGISGKTKEEALFLHWYVAYLKKNNYLGTNDYQPLYKALTEWIQQTKEQLTLTGFVSS